MSEFELILSEGKPNSLGRTQDVVDKILENRTKLNELFECLFSSDEYVRMRAGDGLEKLCRLHPDWLEPYVDRLLGEVAGIEQSSVRWHLAEMLGEIELRPAQRDRALAWLKQRLSDERPDWIVARRCMETLVKFVHDGFVAKETATPFIQKQTYHHSKATAKVARELLADIGG